MIVFDDSAVVILPFNATVITIKGHYTPALIIQVQALYFQFVFLILVLTQTPFSF